MPEDPPDPTPETTRQPTVTRSPHAVAAASAAVVVPAMVAAGERATRRFLEFFAATIRNRNTRQAYLTAASRFFAWCDRHRTGKLADIEPLHVAAYIENPGRHFRSRRSSSTWPPCPGCSTGWLPAASSRPTRHMPSAVRSAW